MPFDQKLAAARRNHQGIGGWLRADRQLQRHRCERAREDELIRTGCACRLAEQLFRHDRPEAPGCRVLGIRNRLDANKERPECSGSDEERRGAVDALPIDVGHPARPGDGQRGGVVHGDTRDGQGLTAQGLVQRFEQVLRGRLVSSRRPNEIRGSGDSRRQRRQGGGAGVEALAQFPLDSHERFLIGGAKSLALEHASTERDDRRQDEACRHRARQRVPAARRRSGPRHTQPQNTRAPRVLLVVVLAESVPYQGRRKTQSPQRSQRPDRSCHRYGRCGDMLCELSERCVDRRCKS